MARDKKQASVARSVLAGVVILALVAISIAWLDRSGIFNEIIRAFEAQRY